MTIAEILAIFAAGLGAGAINTLVGSGTLITFPTLVAFGYAPVTATISNAIGLVAGGVSGTWGYRRELAGQWTIERQATEMMSIYEDLIAGRPVPVSENLKPDLGRPRLGGRLH